MVKSLGDYNKEKSSSADFKNITWTRKNPTETEKPRNRNKKKISPSNILPPRNIETSKTLKKVYKIEEITSEEKSNRNISDKKSQKSSAENSKIKPSFKRPAR